MALASKVLWIVDMNAAGQDRLLAHAQAAGATAVCIRTSNASLATAIARFHASGIKVYGWRWPAVVPVQSASHSYAADEAAYVANTLIPAGLNGYVVDPESDAAGAVNDWNQVSLKPLAQSFCQTIRDAAAAAGRPFFFGTTSGCGYPIGKPNIPWEPFVEASDALLPQTYWRWTNPQGHVEPINGGSPGAAIARGMSAWAHIAKGKPIVPMVGELDVVTAAEIAAFGARIQALGVAEAHVYADGPGVTAESLAAIRAL